jgi:hypothetical protein
MGLGWATLERKVVENGLLRAFCGQRTMRCLEGDFCLRKAKALLRRFGGRGHLKIKAMEKFSGKV